MADLVGTVIVLAVTVTLVAVLATTLLSGDAPDAPVPDLMRVEAAVKAGEEVVHLRHAGGDPIGKGDVRAIVLVNRIVRFDGPLGAPGTTWEFGNATDVGPLAIPLPAGADVEVTLVATLLGHVITTVVSTVADDMPPAGTPALVEVTFATGTNTSQASGGDTVAVHANVSHANGRKFIHLVRADVAMAGVPRFTMTDDGGGADMVPGDGIFTGIFAVPPGTPLATYNVTVSAVDLDGIEGTGNATVVVVDSLVPPGRSGRLLVTGTVIDGLPSSANATTLLLRNLTWDNGKYDKIQDDVIMFRIVDNASTMWTAVMVFDKGDNDTVVKIKEFSTWSVNGGCRWRPTGQYAADSLDILFPENNPGMGTRDEGGYVPSGLPACSELSPGVFTSSYQNAGIIDPAVLVVTHVGDRDLKIDYTSLVTAELEAD